MCDLFEEWIRERSKTNLSPRTIKRYRDSYSKYLQDTILDSTPISKITPAMVTDFFNEMIRDHNLTDKQYANIIVIPNKLFAYAAFKGIIPESPMVNAMINRRALTHTHAAKTSDRIYFPEEKQKFMATLTEFIDEDDTRSDYYAILLLWVLGLRIGELVALKWSDIDYPAREIHIQRMESRGEDDKPVIVDHCKGNSPTADRILSISDYELILFDKIREFNEKNGYISEYIFNNSEGRRKSRAIHHRIRCICRRAKIPEKSAHDIRRTVASELYAHGETLESIRKLLGHSDLKTTGEYIVDIHGNENRNERIHSILSEALPLSDKKESRKPLSLRQSGERETGLELRVVPANPHRKEV